MKNNRNFKSNLSSSCSKNSEMLSSWKCIRPCAVRLERINYVEKQSPDSQRGNETLANYKSSSSNDIPENCPRLKIILNQQSRIDVHKYLVRPCSVSLERIQLKLTSFHQIKQKPNLQEDCKVVLDPLRYAEITVTTPSKGFREIRYVLEAKKVNNKTQKYEDWRCETIKALPAKHKEKSLITGSDSNLFLKIPLELSHVFSNNGIKKQFPVIISVLSGNSMSSSVLDAYLIRRLEKYKTKLKGKQQQQQQSLRWSVTPSSPNNFQYLSILYYPIVKTDDIFNEFPSEPYQMFAPKFSIDENTVLIAPLLACKHFYLSIYDFPSRIIHVYDSCWKFVPMDVRFTQIQVILKHLLIENPHLNQHWTQWSINLLESCVQQSDDVNCGCFVIHFMDNLLNGKTTTEASLGKLGKMEFIEMRRDIARELLKTTKIGRQILEAITE